ncbi:MAG: acylphosphatase [Candidatus Marinimicrobia bacterium]|nr:acylphosphatase [Candidatus Neomarinimicrobiota bacterium]
MPAFQEHETVRRRVIYSGRVQGVGFRYTTNAIARRHPISGYVRNCSDATVELEVEGTPQAVDAFLSEVNRRFGWNITDRRVTEIPCQESEPVRGFSIRH